MPAAAPCPAGSRHAGRLHHAVAPSDAGSSCSVSRTRTAATLARAQLHAGRFAAVADGFAAARALGDDAPATLLGHALALAGSWRHAEAAQVLLAHGAALPAGDRGLALALAGEPEVAVRLLVLAVEDEPDSAALRQNLPFAFAMAGRWGEARALAAVDVPPGQLPARMEKWARTASAGPTPQRMALMLGIAPPLAPKPRRALAWRRPHWAGARW
jgi:Flp pilus assembly protein TadD